MLSASDLTGRLKRLEQQEKSSEIQGILHIEEQLLRLIGRDKLNLHIKADENSLAPLLLSAWPDRLAMKRVAAGEQFLLAVGRGARLSPHCGVRQHDLLVALQVDGGSGPEGVIHLASAVTTDQIRQTLPDLVQKVRQVFWDESSERVTAAWEERIGAVVLLRRQVKADDAEAVPLLLEQVQRRGMASLGWTTAARQLQGRVLLAARLLPEEGWPELSDARLLEHPAKWLGPYLRGIRSWQELERVDLLAPLRDLLGWKLLTTLDIVAPAAITVPSGRSIQLDYSSPEGPVLAVKLQELFGLADSPAVCRGRMALLVHLLSPAGRPVAITRDLRGFWERGYPEVRKELRGRYPRHPWPDDPWNAPATQKTKKALGNLTG